jgi:hypothetical protein
MGLGVVGIILIIVLVGLAVAALYTVSTSKRPCPHCRTMMPKKASKCPHCHKAIPLGY